MEINTDILVKTFLKKQNNINSNEIKTIVEQALSSPETLWNETKIAETGKIVLELFETRILQVYFKNHLNIYCSLISGLIQHANTSDLVVQYLKADCLFNKNIITEEKFVKKFCEHIVPALVSTWIKYPEDEVVFEAATKIVQKCLFHRNFKTFEAHFKYIFEESSEEKQNIPRTLLKYLISASNLETNDAKMTFKLIFLAFCKTYHDFDIIYKFFVVLVDIMGFNLDSFLEKSPAKKTNKSAMILEKSLEILLELCLVLSENTVVDLNCKINEITLTDFMKNLMKSIMFLSENNATIYKILVSTIAINPLIVETIISEILVYSMLGNNDKIQLDYELLIINMFKVFAKLHRVQSFISKMIPTLKSALTGELVFETVYTFEGLTKLPKTRNDDYKVNKILSESILECFTQCITNLVSWQVINLFKTLLHHLNGSVDELPNIKWDTKELTYVEILSILTYWLLRSVRIAEYSVANSAEEKFVAGLEDLRGILAKFGTLLLNKEHNPVLMCAFLDLSYNWAEIYRILAYYSIHNDFEMVKSVETEYTTCNISYLHSYLTEKQWCLISERITNFGGESCRNLLNKMFLQKLVVKSMFKPQKNRELVANFVKTITANLKENFEQIISNEYIVNNLLECMDESTILDLGESALNGTNRDVLDNRLLINSANLAAMKKINKLFRHKRKHSENESVKQRSYGTRIFGEIIKKDFLYGEDYDGFSTRTKQVFSMKHENNPTLSNPSSEIIEYFQVFKQFPIIYSSENTQKMFLSYLLALHKDLLAMKTLEMKTSCETVIIGIFQQFKGRLLDLFEDVTLLSLYIINYFQKFQLAFTLLLDNVFKHEICIEKFAPVVKVIIDHFEDPNYLQCGLLLLNTINKIRKSRMSKTVKEKSLQFKSMICFKFVKIIKTKQVMSSFFQPFVHALKSLLIKDENNYCLKDLLEHLDDYVNFALEDLASDCLNRKGHLILLSAVLQHDLANEFDEDYIEKIWGTLKSFRVSQEDFDEFSQLMVLIFEHCSNDFFGIITKDLLDITEQSFKTKNVSLCCQHLKTWESILGCSFNETKTKIWQGALEKVLQLIIQLLGNDYEEHLFKTIVGFEEVLIQTKQLHLTSPLIDMLILTITSLILKQDDDFHVIFSLSINIMDGLLKSRKALLMDRLPPFLQQYRLLLKALCIRSNSDFQADVKNLSDSAHKLEKLTKNLVRCQKDMSRISMYLIADVLEQYEQVTLYPNVKMHLNNCIYSLISLCDEHAVSFLMRVLSNASTEIFKIMYEHYNKYYRFTGKV